MDFKFQNVCVIGLGYVGLPTAAIIANRGVNVLGVDKSKEAIRAVSKGRVHIVEPDLDVAVHAAVLSGKLKAASAIESSEAFIIAVPTPFDEKHEPDLSFLEAVIEELAPVLKKGDLVVLESTSPVGTTENISKSLAKKRPDLAFPHEARDKSDINIAHSPERIMPGNVLVELVRNDRVVGGVSTNCTKRAVMLYQQFVRGKCLETNSRTAEMVKLSENSFRDVNIAFANELSIISDHLGIDVWKVIKFANRHPRVNILNPGPGVGGHCIAVDPWFIISSSPQYARLIRTARDVNESKPVFILDKVKSLAEKFKEPKVACLGLSYKSGTDDLRESPSLDIAVELAKENTHEVLIVEPHIHVLPPELAQFPHVRLTTFEVVEEQADIVLLLVDHDEFLSIDKQRLNSKVLVDTRGIWSS